MSTLFTGDKELRKVMRKAATNIKKATSKGLSKAARPIIQKAKANVRPQSVTVAKSLGLKRKRYAAGAVQSAIIGPRVGSYATTKQVTNPITGNKTTKKHEPWHTAHLIEGGTAPHTIHLKDRNLVIQHPGTKPKPFLEPAFESSKIESVKIYADTYRVELAKLKAKV